MTQLDGLYEFIQGTICNTTETVCGVDSPPALVAVPVQGDKVVVVAVEGRVFQEPARHVTTSVRRPHREPRVERLCVELAVEEHSGSVQQKRRFDMQVIEDNIWKYDLWYTKSGVP